MLPGFGNYAFILNPNRKFGCEHPPSLKPLLSQQIRRSRPEKSLSTLLRSKSRLFSSRLQFFHRLFSCLEFVSVSSRMVKVSFNSALGQKDVKKDAETLIPEEDKDAEAALPVRHQSRAWCWCMCLGLALMLSGVVVGGAYLYRYYILEVSRQPQQGWNTEEGPVFVCGMNYREEDFMMREEEDEVEVELPNQFHLRQLEERIRVLEREQVELINIPVPEFDNGDPADIVHDFQRRLTAYLDLSLNKCYVIPLNTSIVMPPRDFLELLVNIKAGTYLPQSYLVHEEMIVTERLEHVDQLGYFIYNLCRGKDTFKLQRRDRILGMQKREALNCHKIRHFGSKFVVETLICEP